MKNKLFIFILLLVCFPVITQADTAVATDSFHRSLSLDLGSNWTDIDPGMQVYSNAAHPDADGSGYDMSWYNAATFANDQYSKDTLVVGGGTSMQMLILVRATGSTPSAASFYTCFLYGGGTEVRALTYLNGSFTQIGTFETSSVFTNGDVYKCAINGTGFSFYRNGTQVGSTITDASFSSGAPGIGGLSNLTSFDVGVDTWEGGNVGGAPPAATPLNNTILFE